MAGERSQPFRNSGDSAWAPDPEPWGLPFLHDVGISAPELHQAVQQVVRVAAVLIASLPRQPAPTAAAPLGLPPPGSPPTLDLCQADPAPAAGPRTDPDASPVLVHARALYASEIGLVTPLVDGELRRLSEQHPDPSAWDTAFHEAVRANVRQLRYVSRVLESRAHGTSRSTPSTGGSHARRSKPSRSSGRPARSRSGRRLTDEDYAELQRRAAAIEPLDLLATLGTAAA